MSIDAKDRAADEESNEKAITKTGETFVELIDADRIDCQHLLERERIHEQLLEAVNRGLADIANGRTEDADVAIARMQQRRKATAKTSKWRG